MGAGVPGARLLNVLYLATVEQKPEPEYVTALSPTPTVFRVMLLKQLIMWLVMRRNARVRNRYSSGMNRYKVGLIMWHKMLIQNKYEIIRISKHTFLHLLCNNIFYYFVITNDAAKRNHMLYTMTPRIDFYEYWREKIGISVSTWSFRYKLCDYQAFIFFYTSCYCRNDA